MSDQAALLAAIINHPDDDTPRLMYADWLDENLPDKLPSPSSGPSARAEFIRVQCRLAGFPFDAPDYPELLEREEDLAEWLETHTPAEDTNPDLPEDLEWYGSFNGEGDYHRGFPTETSYSDFDDDEQLNINRILDALPEAFEQTTIRGLMLDEAYGSEIAGVVSSPVVAGLRALSISDVADEGLDVAVRAIAESPHLTGLRDLDLDYVADEDSLRRLSKARGLGALESFSLHDLSPKGLKLLGAARWFRNLRSLDLGLDNRDSLKSIAEFPTMPNLVSLALSSSNPPTITAMRKFVASKSFPRLAKLDFSYSQLTPELVAVFARGEWPLAHLNLPRVALRKSGTEALVGAAFADTLRVLDLSSCEVTAGGVQALAASERLAGLRRLDLGACPIGPGGLMALARSKHLRGLRSLSLASCNTPKAPLDAADVLNFLSALEMPDLRHLRLDHLPVGIRGARVLAGGSFAGLTRLSLSACGLREKGARAIIESGAFPNLSSLDMSENNAGKGLAKLADPKTFPRLANASVGRNRVSKSIRARLQKRTGVRV